MEDVNQSLFLLINAPAHPDASMLLLAHLLADYAIWLIPIGLIGGWLWGGENIRRVMLLATLAGLLGLLINQLIGLIWQHPRPFMIGLGHSFSHHSPESSFPSDHLTLLWAVAFSLLPQPSTRRAGAALTLLGLPVAWARIYLGVHFPFDMLGAALVAAMIAGLCHASAGWLVDPLLPLLNRLYGRWLQPLLRRG